MYERQYGTEHLWAEAAEDVIDETYKEIVDLEDLNPIDNPSVEVTQLEPGKPLTYKATVVVRPEVELGDYQAHGATVEPTPPTDADIEKTVDSMREQHAELKPVDRESKSGDIVMVDIDVTVDGKQLPPFARNAHVEAGRESSIKGLGEAFVGPTNASPRPLIDDSRPASTWAFRAKGGSCLPSTVTSMSTMTMSPLCESRWTGLSSAWVSRIESMVLSISSSVGGFGSTTAPCP